MHDFMQILFASGQKGFELAFFILMPIMVFMMAIMRVLDRKGVLRRVAIVAAPLLLLFGIPGLGAFAIVQILFVSFAAPTSTFRIMDQDAAISDRKIAAGFAAVLCMSQANATFPLSAFGLNLPVVMLTSLGGGLIAAWATYRFFARQLPDSIEPPAADEIRPTEDRQSLDQMILSGGEEGFQLALKAVPVLVLAVLLVNVLKALGAIGLLEAAFGPVLTALGVSPASVLPIVTKYIAGGTAMMGTTLPLLQDQTMTALDLNRIAGFTINTLDPVGFAVLLTAGRRFSACAVPAAKGALLGILARGITHLLVF